MPQTITPELEAILVSHLQVGDDKPQAEIEIDRVGAIGGPLLDSAQNGTSTPVSSWQLPTVTSDVVPVMAVAWVQHRGPATLTPPAGWTLRETLTAHAYPDGTSVYRLYDRLFETGASPYEDVFAASAAIRWSVAQELFRAAGVQPGNSDAGQVHYGSVQTNPEIVLPLGFTPEAGNVLVAYTSAITDTGPTIGAPAYTWPAGWTELEELPSTSSAIGVASVAYKVADGTETDVSAIFNSDQVLDQFLIVAEYAIAATDADATTTIQVAQMDIDRSRKMAAAQLDVTVSNEDGDKGWYTQASDFFIPNNPIRGYAWYGDRANRVCVFTGLIDRLAEHRNPKQIAIKARSRMKWMLEQSFRAIGPQGADEEGAVRTEDNGVYLSKSIEYIVGDILDRAGWPAADRDIPATGITLSEYVLTDKGSWADQIAGADRLTTATGWDLWEDEVGVIHFEPSPLIAAIEPTPAWDFAAGVNVLALDHQVDDEARATRVEVGGPMTSAVPIWELTWSTSVLDYPAGAWYDPADPDNIRVIDRRTKYIYTIRQSDRAIVAKKYLGGYPFGLSGDPLDATHYYVLNAPYWNTGSLTGNSVKEYRKSDNVLLATHALPDGKWSSLKTDGVNLWLANYGDHKIYKRDMTAGAVSSATISYGGDVQEKPTGIWINGTVMGVFFSAFKRFLLVDTSAPTVVTGVQSTEGTRIAGGEADTDTDTDLYVVSGKGSWGLTSGMVAKFALAELVTTDVTALAIDYDLEDALGIQSGIAARDHGDCPNIVGDHQFEARLTTYSMKVVQSLAQAQDVADAQLALLSRLRRVLDLGTTGHPGIQINDPINYTDAIAGIDSTWVIDSYRKRIAQTYTQTMSVLPWEAPA